MEEITAAHVTNLLKQLRHEFQYVVIDTAPGLGEHVLAALEQATDAVWVCGMDVPSIRGLRTGFHILNELGLMPESRHVVLNMADGRSGLTVPDVEATIGVPVDVAIPRSRTLPFSTNKGVPSFRTAAGTWRRRAFGNSSSASSRTGRTEHIASSTEGR